MTDEYDRLPRPSLLQQRPAAPDEMDVNPNLHEDNPDDAAEAGEADEDDDAGKRR